MIYTPIEGKEEQEELNKIGAVLQEEIEKEVDRIVTFSFRDRDKLGHLDLGSLEIYIRSSMHAEAV